MQKKKGDSMRDERRKRSLMLAGALSVLFSAALADAENSNVDNSRMNQRDRSDTQVTADQQAMDRNSQELVARIRDAVVKRGDLSTYAHNIKIIADGSGSVFLRGPVNSSAERDAVGKIAADIAGAGKVKNELEVTNR